MTNPLCTRDEKRSEYDISKVIDCKKMSINLRHQNHLTFHASILFIYLFVGGDEGSYMYEIPIESVEHLVARLSVSAQQGCNLPGVFQKGLQFLCCRSRSFQTTEVHCFKHLL